VVGADGHDFANVSLYDVTKTFGSGRRRSVTAVDDVSLSFETGGSTIGIVGESGSGKSTLARMVVGLQPQTSGSIAFNGNELAGVLRSGLQRRRFRRAVQFVGQNTTSSFDPRRTLRDAVRLPVMTLVGLDRRAADERVDEILTLMGLPIAYADRRPHQVSGGQRQRFAIARGLVVRPRLLVCDEVVSALDVSIQGSILNLLKRYCADNGAGLLFVSHGLPATAFIADEIVVMYRGQVVDRGATEDIIGGDDVHPYTAGLLAAVRRPKVGAP
jgi:peptide/nickel transport system ATP-binding protein